MRMVRDAEIRRLRDLELIVQGIPVYRTPKLALEQYVTDANIVAVAVWDAYMRGYLVNARVLDLGCGTGRFSIAAAIMGARHVVCIDVDPDAVEVAREYSARYGLDNVDFVVMDVRLSGLRGNYDVVFQNPPFGIQSERGLDVEFLRVATDYGNVVYTMHKLTTMEFISNRLRNWGCTMDLLDTATITIPPTYPHHRKRRHKVGVFLARVTCSHGKKPE